MNAIEVTTETKINHYQLGLSAASDWNNAEQGEFLLGMADGFADLKGAGHMQIHYIVQGAPEPNLRAIRHFVELLAEYFKDES
jgi:hypothetical protein